MRHWEDLAVGQVYELGSFTVTADDIVAFARQWDPQVFHVDEARAMQTPFGGLVASGWHTTAIFMRLYVDAFLADTSCQGGAGVDELRWLHPVRPGDTLHGRATVQEVWASRTRVTRGSARLAWELRNQDDELVLQMQGVNLFGRRPADAT